MQDVPPASAQAVSRPIGIPMTAQHPGFSSRTVLITGTSSGIGLATAIAAARAGWTTIATMRNLAGPTRCGPPPQRRGCNWTSANWTSRTGRRSTVRSPTVWTDTDASTPS